MCPARATVQGPPPRLACAPGAAVPCWAMTAPLPGKHLPPGVSARLVADVNGLAAMHLLEAGPADGPVVLLLHGFPELAFSWRHVMPGLASAGFRVLAPDLRGYGRTSFHPIAFSADFQKFGMLGLARHVVGLLARLGIARTRAVVGHDFGSPLAAWCALLRPDLFPACVLMSAPFAGAPPLPEAGPAPGMAEIIAGLAALPAPRTHYQWHYSTEAANAEMWHPPQGLKSFLRSYFHMKSADWRLADGTPANRPEPLPGWTAEAFARLPTYYVMEAGRGMAETVAPHAPSAAEAAACAWLSEADLDVYAEEYGRTGFQGGLNWYRGRTSGRFAAEESLFAGARIEVPALFIAGAADWGVFQFPGAVEAMRGRVFSRMAGVELVPGAGHWVQQEQPQAVLRLLRGFLAGLG